MFCTITTQTSCMVHTTGIPIPTIEAGNELIPSMVGSSSYSFVNSTVTLGTVHACMHEYTEVT